MNNFDRFYPSLGHTREWTTEQQLEFVTNLLTAMRCARDGCSEKESALCNMVGSIRRDHSAMSDLPEAINVSIREAVDYLRTTGRTVNLKGEDPQEWITMRDGKPRWTTLKTFKVPVRRPDLLGNSALNERADVVAFIERFGKRWEKGPLPGVWWLLADGDQFTWRNNEFAHYMFDSKEEFIELYGSGLDALYFDRDTARWKYTVLQLMDHLKTAHS